MPTEAAIITEGKVVSVLPGTMFRVELENQHLVLAHFMWENAEAIHSSYHW